MPDSRAIRVVTAAVTVRLQVPPSVFAPQPRSTEESLGVRLAVRVDEVVRAGGLGYYPALDFLIQSGEIGSPLLAELEQASARVLEYIAREVPRRLKPVFSSVQLRNGQFTARALPPVRPGQPEALEQLARHYTPDTVRLELSLSTIARGETGGLERVAAQKVTWWLREHFATVEVLDVRPVGAP